MFDEKPFVLCPDCDGEVVLAGTNYVCKECDAAHDQMKLLAKIKDQKSSR